MSKISDYMGAAGILTKQQRNLAMVISAGLLVVATVILLFPNQSRSKK